MLASRSAREGERVAIPPGHEGPESAAAPAHRRGNRCMALIGNPNTGKSTLFGALTGLRQHVGNYPGVTVEKRLGQLTHTGRRWVLVDLPGIYSLAPRSPDEMIVVDVLLGQCRDVARPDVILCVVDATNLERNFYLVGQVLELGRPTVIALTMTDVARAGGWNSTWGCSGDDWASRWSPSRRTGGSGWRP